jgi:CIC family chloride channel protein
MSFFKHFSSAYGIGRLQTRLSRNQFLVLSGVLVGVTAGTAGLLLKTGVHNLRLLIEALPSYGVPAWLSICLPFVAIVGTVFIVQRFFAGEIGKGIGAVLNEIARNAGFVRRAKMYSHLITSAFTVGLGGSAGLESPIVITGAAIGSNYARFYRLGFKDRLLLLASGTAAGIAAIFNAPIAGVVFAIEVLLLDATAAEMIPLIIASVCGALVSHIVLQEDILLVFSFKTGFDYTNVPYYVVLGIICGFMSLYYARVFTGVESLSERFKRHPWLRGAAGGIMLAALCAMFPPLFGEGYQSIRYLANDLPKLLFADGLVKNVTDSPLLMLGMLIFIPLIKVFATALTISSGGNGGNFGPSLFVGAFTGYAFSHAVMLLNLGHLPVSNITLVGMAGILSGVMYAPLTGIFLIAEVTSGYDLVIPLMIVSSISYIIVRHFDLHSMEARKAARQGGIFTESKDQNVLSIITVESILERDICTVSPHAPLRKLVEIIREYRRNMFAVVDDDGLFVGLIMFDDMRDVMFRTEMYDTIVAFDLVRPAPAEVQIDDDMRSVMSAFESTRAWNLPALEGRRFRGVVSKSALLDKYREKLKEQE